MGVAAQIQKEEPLALYVHCRTNLCLQAVGKQSKLVYYALDLVMGLSKLINFSPKRSALFKNVQLQQDQSALTLKSLCPTRWTVRSTPF